MLVMHEIMHSEDAKCNNKEGYQIVPSNFQVLAKFGLCSICSQNLNECSLARARKLFALARMLGFFFKFPRLFKIS